MQIAFSPPDITDSEIHEVADTLKSGWITTGPKTKLFEQKIADFCNTNKAACLSSATASMELTLLLLGVGEGDEVITTAYTYTATASVIHHVGAQVVLVDTKEDSYHMDYDALDDAITERTKAIIPVDIAGVICDYSKILQIVNKHQHKYRPNSEIGRALGRIAVIADAAHSFGATYHGIRSGLHADFTCFSFHAVKNLTTAEGGAVTWKEINGINDDAIYKQYMLLSLHGQSKDALAKNQLGAWEYDILLPAYKCNMTDIMAAIGLVQVNRYPELLQRRQHIIERYNEGLQGLDVTILNHYTKDYASSGHLYLLRLNGLDEEERNHVIFKMAEYGIATNVHYKPLPMHTAYKKMGFHIADYPNAYNMYKNEITLPLHSQLSDEDVDYVTGKLSEILENL